MHPVTSSVSLSGECEPFAGLTRWPAANQGQTLSMIRSGTIPSACAIEMCCLELRGDEVGGGQGRLLELADVGMSASADARGGPDGLRSARAPLAWPAPLRSDSAPFC